MKNYKKISVFFKMSFLLLLVLALSPFGAKGAQTQALDQEDLVNLTRPGVVRIVQHVKGEAIIKPFKLDLNKLTISPSEGENQTVPVDEYTTGSGFVVSQDGYILTNSHVILDRDTKLKAITGVATEKIREAPVSSSFSGPDGNVKTREYVDKIKDYLLQNSQFNFQEELVVLNPSSLKNGVVELMKEGFPAKIISSNDNFAKDSFDVALIKIDQTNLPALPFGDVSSLQGGQKIGIFGFPTTAELNDNSLVEATFTQGVISAIKDSDNQAFKIIQTDAKISDGSSGSPLLDEGGKVIGMVTYQTQRDRKDNGDNFAFAIPINSVQEGIQKFNTSGGELKLNLGQYNKQFLNGINFFRQSSCKEALSILTEVKSFNEKFNVAKSVNPYIQKCQDLISSKQSVDTPLDALIHTLAILSPIGWLAILLLICVFVAIAIVLVRQKEVIKEEREEIVFLEEEVKQNKEIEEEEKKEIEKIEEELKEIKGKK